MSRPKVPWNNSNFCDFHAAYILLSYGSSTDIFQCATTHQNLEINKTTKVNLMKMTYCESNSSEKFVQLPDDLSNDIMALQMEMKSDASWLITEPRVFSKISTLKTIYINVSKTWQISNSTKEWIDFVTSTLFFDTKIDYLFITYHKEFNDRVNEKWKLPERLIEFYFNNSLMNFDLNSCNNLQTLHATNALLDKMPENSGLLNLKELNLGNNPLRDFTVLDIARFCLLETLALENVAIEPCECLMLKKFVDEEIRKYNPKFELKSDLSCGNGAGVDCSGYNLDEAIRLRMECFSTIFWNTMLIVIVVLAVLACTCLCGVMTSLLLFGLASSDW